MPRYGTFDMPTLLPYPTIGQVKDVPEIMGIFCYVVEGYDPGYSCLIKRQGGEAGVALGDWSGGHGCSEEAMRDIVPKMIKLMVHINLEQAQFYFDSGGRLVDVQISINKFMGPGMLRDLFANLVPTQTVVSTDTINQDKIDQIKPGHILKPSRFRYYEHRDQILPLYARI